MKTLELHLPDQTASKLAEVAKHLGLSAEELLMMSLEEKLAQLDVEFREALEHVATRVC